MNWSTCRYLLQIIRNCTCMRHFINKNWAIFITPRLLHVLWSLTIRDTKWKLSGCLYSFSDKSCHGKRKQQYIHVHVHVYRVWNNAERCNVIWVVNFNDEIKTPTAPSRGSIYMTMCTLLCFCTFMRQHFSIQLFNNLYSIHVHVYILLIINALPLYSI